MIAVFEKDVFPHIGHRPIDSITPRELMAVLSRLEKEAQLRKCAKCDSAAARFGSMR